MIKTRPRGRALSLIALAALFSFGPPRPAWAEDFLIAGDLTGDENRIDLLYGTDGLISYMEVTDYPGQGYMTRTSIDVVPEDWMAHGPRLVPDELITPLDGGGWRVEGDHTFPAVVRISAASIELELGDEICRVSKPKDYLVEIMPRLRGGEADTTRRFAYAVARNRPPGTGFLGILDKSYLPVYKIYPKPRTDWLADTYPRRFTMGGPSLEAYVYSLGGQYPDSPDYEFKYTVTFAADRGTNLRNYLILLTRRADNPGLFIHPVLLTLLYFDSLVN